MQSNNACLECPDGSYLINLDNNSEDPCVECDSTRMICTGKDRIYPKKGYWRLNESSDLIIECPTSPACLGAKEVDSSRRRRILEDEGEEALEEDADYID